MASIINAEKISKTYTGRVLLDDVDFSIQEGEHVGIVGINGTGKSTLLRIVAGEVEPDSGEVIYRNGMVMSYLPQTPEFDSSKTVKEAVRDMALSNKNTEAYHTSTADLDAKIANLLTRFGIDNHDDMISNLSGGQRKRAALVAVLVAPSDFLLLDEPTNHLDYDMVEWLENYLENYKGTILLITHDRYFLDSVTTRIVEVTHGKLFSYDTNYSGFLELKAERLQMEESSEHTRQNILRKEIAWMQRGARARSTKQKAHIQRYEALLEKSGPTYDSKVDIKQVGSIGSRMGKSTIEIENLCKSFDGKTLIKNFSYNFQHHDRVAFIGRNGCGKTTLMKILTGRENYDSGEIKIGQTIQIGYYAQEITEAASKNVGSIEYMDPTMKVIDYIRNTAEYIKTSEGLVSASSMLDRFLFPPSEQYSLIEKLSGGERRRLNLLRVLMENPNVLILDEPTNDLDTETLAVLEDFLDSFDGIVITVSHDRYFLDRMVSRLFVFELDGTLKPFEGSYTEYIKKNGAIPGSVSLDKASNSTNKNSDSKATWTHEKKVKFTYKEQKEWETIEEDIEKIENRLSEIEDEMVKFATDFGKLNDLQKENEKLEKDLEEKMERWEYLSDIYEKIKAAK
ncbi:MAG: ABC-F family ATP-binding cassette domain-containing protein [Lachnospiraceae bacterium]|nr:ABC-F family ATP-binding cassette domain-containing protein [Lachnospiraceae bacterium]